MFQTQALARGAKNTLHPANQRNSEPHLQAGARISEHPNYALLFDPQTAGGLLAAIPNALGYAHAAIIGETRPRDGEASTICLMIGKQI